jgi:ankyrin repeat protein
VSDNIWWYDNYYNTVYYICCIFKHGNTPLIISVQNGNMEMFKLLLDNGALSSINTPCNVNIW